MVVQEQTSLTSPRIRLALLALLPGIPWRSGPARACPRALHRTGETRRSRFQHRISCANEPQLHTLWMRTVREDCPDHRPAVSKGHLEEVLAKYIEHYNRGRPRRSTPRGNGGSMAPTRLSTRCLPLEASPRTTDPCSARDLARFQELPARLQQFASKRPPFDATESELAC